MAGSITISIEAGTVGLGTILPATSIEYYQGEQLSSVLLRLLQNTGFDWRNNGDATSGFYLKAIGRGGISANAAIPDDLMAHLQEVTVSYPITIPTGLESLILPWTLAGCIRER